MERAIIVAVASLAAGAFALNIYSKATPNVSTSKRDYVVYNKVSNPRSSRQKQTGKVDQPPLCRDTERHATYVCTHHFSFFRLLAPSYLSLLSSGQPLSFIGGWQNRALPAWTQGVRSQGSRVLASSIFE